MSLQQAAVLIGLFVAMVALVAFALWIAWEESGIGDWTGDDKDE